MTNSINQSGPSVSAEMVAGMTQMQTAGDTTQAEAAKASNQKTLAQGSLDEGNNLVGLLKNADNKIKPQKKEKEKLKEAGATAKQLKPPKQIEEEAQKFGGQHPKMAPFALLALTRKLKDGMTKDEVLKIIKEQYPNAEDASFALQFLASIAIEGSDYQKFLREIQTPLEEDIRERENAYAKEKAAEAVKAAQESKEAAIRMVLDGDPNKLFEQLVVSPLEATAIYKLLDDAYGKSSKKIQLFLLKKCADEVKPLKLKDKESIVEMKVAMNLLKIMQSILGAGRYFEIRNQDKGPKKQTK